MKNEIKHVTICLLIMMLTIVPSHFSHIHAAETGSGRNDIPEEYRGDIVNLQISDNADIQEIEFLSVDNSLCKALQILEPLGEGYKATIILPFLESYNGNISLISAMKETDEEPTRTSATATRSSITAIAYYNRIYKNGAYLYQPYRLEALTTSSYSMGVAYETAGAGYNSSGTFLDDGSHSISIYKASPSTNTWYSVSKTASYYFNVNLGLYQWHYIAFSLNGNSLANYQMPQSY